MNIPKRYQKGPEIGPSIGQAMAFTEQTGMSIYRRPISTFSTHKRLRRQAHYLTDLTRKQHRKQKRMLQALWDHDGRISEAVQEAGISRQTHYNWLEESQEYRDEVELVENSLLDKARSVLIRVLHLSESDETADLALALKAAMFILERKGRSRGWGSSPSTVVQVNQGFELKIVTEETKPVVPLETLLDGINRYEDSLKEKERKEQEERRKEV